MELDDALAEIEPQSESRGRTAARTVSLEYMLDIHPLESHPFVFDGYMERLLRNRGANNDSCIGLGS